MPVAKLGVEDHLMTYTDPVPALPASKANILEVGVLWSSQQLAPHASPAP